MWWNLWSIARSLNQAFDLLKDSRAYLPTPYVPQLISPLAQQYPILKDRTCKSHGKKLSVHFADSLTHENLLKTLNYIMYMSGVDPFFFFDVNPVTEIQRQIGGHGKKGLPAVEVQRYASNCNYTVNLLNGRLVLISLTFWKAFLMDLK